MHLSSEEVARFYGIWFPLLHYVNQRRKVIASFPARWHDAAVQAEDAVAVRNALWEDDTLREAFISENPASLSEQDLALVDSWKYRVADDFFVLRYLKSYTVFLAASEPVRGFGVLGVTGPIEEIIGPYLPLYVKAVLLPFGDRIIYDSLLSSYSIYFGGGVRRSLKEGYQEIQERGGVVTSLLPASETDMLARAKAGNKKLLAAFQKELGKTGVSPKMMQEHTDNIAAFADEYLLEHTPPGLLLDITQEDIAGYRQVKRGKVNRVSFKRFVRFLRDTDRMDWDQADDLLAYLKNVSHPQ